MKNPEYETWVLVNPDDETYSEKDILSVLEKYDRKYIKTSETRDTGFGQERKFIVNDPDDFQEFIEVNMGF